MANTGLKSLARVRRFYPEVKTVVDSCKPILVSITDQDRKTGKRKAPNACAMARACERQLKVDGAIIRTSVAYLIKGTKATRFLVPQSVAREIVSFDRHKDFQPGEYQLTRVRKAQRLGTKRPVWTDRGIRRPKHKAPLVVHRTAGIR